MAPTLVTTHDKIGVTMRRKVVHAVLGVSLMAAMMAVPQATVGAQAGWSGFTAVSVPSGLQGGGANASPAWSVGATEDLGGSAPDLWVNNHGQRSEALEDYIGGGTVFTDSVVSDLTLADSHGVTFTDFDGDGDEDLIETNGRDDVSPIWRNDGGSLTQIAAPTGFEDLRGRGRQTIMVDFDGDGDMDALTANLDRTLLSCDDGDSDEDPATPDCSDHDLNADPPVGEADAPAVSTMYLNDGTGTTWSPVEDVNDAIDDGSIRYLHLTSTGPATPQSVLTSSSFAFAIDSIAANNPVPTAAASPVNRIEFAADNMTNARDIALGDLDGDLAPEAVVARQDEFLGNDLLGTLPIGIIEVSTSALASQVVTDISDDARIDNCRTVALGDFDNDADLDIFGGCTMIQKVAEGVPNLNVILLNDGEGNFTINSSLVPASTTETATVAITSDFDGNGWLDTYVGTGNDSEPGPDFIFLNSGGTSNHWLQIDLVDPSNPDVAGAQVFVGTDKWQVRETGHRLHRGQDMKTLHFGLGSEAFIAPVEIQWPDGTFSSCVVDGVDQRVTITKGGTNCTAQTSGGLLTTLAAAPDRTTPEMCDGLFVTVDLGEGETPTTGDDVILGTEQADTINALGGDDVICALGGNDEIDAGAGDDTVFGDAGNDDIAGGAGRDFLRGGDGDDAVDGGADNDRIFGDAGNDTLFGQDGRDILQGGIGDDDIEGGKRNDRISGNGGRDTLRGGNGKDRVDGGTGADSVIGGGGNDRLLGGGGNDFINGNVNSAKGGGDFCVEGETVVNCEFDFIP